MKEYPYPYPWKELHGSKEELEFLERRFAEMSVREQYLVEGASQLQSITTAADLINLTEQLDCFDLYASAKDDAGLGRYVAEFDYTVPTSLMSFLKFKEWGRDVRERHGGVFISGGFVEQRSPLEQIYNGTNINMMTGGNASVRLKVASGTCPTGVWIKLPDQEISTGTPDELDVAMAELGIYSWSRALLLDAKCCFNNITDLVNQYDSLDELISDGNNLGYILDEAGQGTPFFIEHFRAALDFEDCTELKKALDISQNLHCYDFFPYEEHWERFGRKLAQERGIMSSNSTASAYFDYATYCQAEVWEKELRAYADGYIARNDQEFIYEFSQLPRQGQEMT